MLYSSSDFEWYPKSGFILDGLPSHKTIVVAIKIPDLGCFQISGVQYFRILSEITIQIPCLAIKLVTFPVTVFFIHLWNSGLETLSYPPPTLETAKNLRILFGPP